MHSDDSQLFAIFSVIFITFWSSQGNLSSKKAGKLKNMQRFKTCHDLLKTCHDSTKQNALFRHWGKRVTMAKTWHDYGNPNFGGLLHKTETCHDLLKSCHDFRSSCCYLSWRLFWKRGLRILERESAICRPGDWRMGRFPPFFTSLCMF
jgi:hypothetical protein